MRAQSGFSMLEVLVTIIILAFGLLGLAGLQTRMQTAELESYQRAQALVLLQDMIDRIRLANPNTPTLFSDFLTSSGPVGTPDTSDTSACATKTGAARDVCDWSNLLKGAAEVSASNAKLGAMQGAAGCIDQVTVPNAATGVCQAGIFRVSVVWQGLGATVAPAVACNRNAYGAENLRRAVSAEVTIGLPTCS